jgi:uncharacterized alpha-E superfamily protein
MRIGVVLERKAHLTETLALALRVSASDPVDPQPDLYSVLSKPQGHQ